MRKWKKARKVITICLAVFFFSLPFYNTVYVNASQSPTVITPGKIQEWDNGAKVTKKSSGSGKNYKVSVKADTNGLSEDYYSVYLYDYTERSVRSCDGIRFYFKNKNQTDMKINLTLTVNSKVSVTMMDSSFAILESNNQSTKEVVLTSYGTITIPANFSGTIYVPFNQLSDSDGHKVTLEKIQSWGITVVMLKDQQIQYTFGNIAFLNNSMEAIKDQYRLITLTGISNIIIPHTGSIIENYRAKVKDLEGNPVKEKVTFSLKESIAGASITKDGKLEVKSTCVASEIIICAKAKNHVNYGSFKVSTERSSTATGTISTIPRAADVPKINSAFYRTLEESVILIRILVMILTIFFGAILLHWFSEAKANFVIIKNKLYKIRMEQEEEKS